MGLVVPMTSGEVRKPWRRFALEAGAIWWDLGGGDPAGERKSQDANCRMKEETIGEGSPRW